MDMTLPPVVFKKLRVRDGIDIDILRRSRGGLLVEVVSRSIGGMREIEDFQLV